MRFVSLYGFFAAATILASDAYPPPRFTDPERLGKLESAMPEVNPWGDQQLSATDDDLTGWLRRGIPFSTPPGTRYEYSNFAFGLLGRIVAKASGMPYETYVRKEILAKLHLDATTFEFSDVPASHRAVGYRPAAGWDIP